MGRSILAVLAGYLTLAAAVVAVDFSLGTLFPGAFPEPVEPGARPPTAGWLGVILLYSSVFAVLGGYVAAWVARRSERLHALAFGLLLEAMTLAEWYATRGWRPAWYHALLALLPIPAALLGGWLRSRRAPGGAAAPTAS
jgi:hypothetical protein